MLGPEFISLLGGVVPPRGPIQIWDNTKGAMIYIQYT